MKNEPNEKQMEAMVKGIKKIMSPQFQAMMNILQLGGARIRRKRNYKEEKEKGGL